MKDGWKIGVEIALTILLVILLICWMPKGADEREPNPTERVTPTQQTPTQEYVATPTPIPTNTPTPIPSNTPTPIPSVTKKVEQGHKFKPYTRHTAYNVKSSQQYKLQQIALTSSDNGIRMVQDPNGDWRYCVALGTYWAGGHPEHIGRCVDVFMQNGATLQCVLADVKRTEDTKNRANRYGEINNDVLEFIVDESRLPNNVNLKTGGNGNVSGAGEQFVGDAVYMIVYDLWIEGFGKE